MTLEETPCGKSGDSFSWEHRPEKEEMFAGRAGKVLLLGLGNTLVSDDGAGIKAVRLAGSSIDDPRVQVEEIAAGGMYLVEAMAGYDTALLVDAVKSEEVSGGDIFRVEIFEEDPGLSRSPASFTHGMGLKKALELAEFLSLPLPQHIEIYGIGAEDTATISEECTPAVERALPGIAEILASRIRQLLEEACRA